MNVFNEKGALSRFLSGTPIRTSAPCRIDMGGTLDIRTFHLPLGYLSPSTVNIALNLRTTVTLLPDEPGLIRISSKGFDSAAFPLDTAPFDHPLGLMFAVAAYFRAEGVHVVIHSASPPKSALGGSSVAAVALVTALSNAGAQMGRCADFPPATAAMLAHAIEESVAGVPCGIQDQLAAAFGGVNAWYWEGSLGSQPFERRVIIPPEAHDDFGRHIVVAYCGIPHESRNVNSRWVRQFLSGANRDQWVDIVHLTHQFEAALRNGDIPSAMAAMNREMDIRQRLTPDVLDDIGERLVSTARRLGCSARISGAGGGGCVWALGEAAGIESLRTEWDHILSTRADARLLVSNIDAEGVREDSTRHD